MRLHRLLTAPVAILAATSAPASAVTRGATSTQPIAELAPVSMSTRPTLNAFCG